MILVTTVDPAHLRVLVVDLVVDLHDGGPGEGEAAGDEAEEGDAQGPDVHLQ